MKEPAVKQARSIQDVVKAISNKSEVAPSSKMKIKSTEEKLKASIEPRVAPNTQMKGKPALPKLSSDHRPIVDNNLANDEDDIFRDDLFTPPKTDSIKSPTYSNYLSSLQSSNSSLNIKDMTVQEQTVAIPITDPLISDQVMKLKPKLSPANFQMIFRNNHAFGIGAQNQGKGKKNKFSILFNYTELHDVECSLDQLIQYAKYSSLFEYQEKEECMNTLDNENLDPCANIEWINYVNEGEEVHYDEQSIPSVFEELEPGDLCAETAFEELGSTHEQEIPYISSKEQIKGREIDNEQVLGVVWSSNEVLQAPKEPEEKTADRPAILKPSQSYRFKSPIESFLSFVPGTLFKKITYESNRYALRKFDTESQGYGKFKLCGMNFQKIRLREILQFH